MEVVPTAPTFRRLTVVVRSPTPLRDVGRNGETTTPGVRPSGRPYSSSAHFVSAFDIAISLAVMVPISAT